MKESLNILKVLAEESRLRIFMALHEQELCVCQIVALLGLAASTTSKHLALMYQAGLIEQRKDGRWAYYSLCAAWGRQNADLKRWLLSELKSSARISSDGVRLQEVLAMPLEQLCQPMDQCRVPEIARTGRGEK